MRKYIRRFFIPLRRNWKELVEFELLYKVLSLAVFTPLFSAVFDLALNITGFHYLTAQNLMRFVFHPVTILLMLLLALLAAFYSLFDICAIIYTFDQSYHNRKVSVNSIIYTSLQTSRKVFLPRNFLVVFFVLFMIPFLNIGLASSYIGTIAIPEFIMEYIQAHWYTLLLLAGGTLVCFIFLIRWIYSLHYFLLEDASYPTACKKSARLIHQHLWMDLVIYLLLELFFYLIYTLIVRLGILIVSLVTSHLYGEGIAYSVTFSFITIFLTTLLVIFSALSAPINYCCISFLYYLHKKEEHEPAPALPKLPLTQSRHASRSRRFIRNARLGLAVLLVCLCYFVIHFVAGGHLNFNIEDLKTTEVSAHRGASVDYPENTFAAFEGAVDLGADWIELDVQQTKDGQMIIMHDSNLYRTTGLRQNIWDVDYADICELDCGSWFASSFRDERIPLLDDVITFARLHNIRLNIELKPTGHETDFEQCVADIVNAHLFTSDCVVTSQDYQTLKRIKECDPELKTVYVMSVAYGRITDLTAADCFSIETSSASRRLIDRIHNTGKEVYVWTVNSSSTMDKLIDLGVDNIITDNVTMAKEAVNKDRTSNMILEIVKGVIH